MATPTTQQSNVQQNANKVVHFSLPFDDAKRASDFYQKAFHWELNDLSGFIQATTTPTDKNFVPKEPGAINGGLIERPEGVHGPIITIQVDSIDNSVEKIKSLGGQLLKPKVELMGNFGYYAYVKDTEGNVIALMEPKVRNNPS